jgi:hypothetical protein
MNRLKVSDIRKKHIQITRNSIIYYWWFKLECLPTLLRNFEKGNCPVDLSKIRTFNFENTEFALLYVGKGKNGNGRLVKYHIHDSSDFHSKGVENGRLSSLRTTLCGLLNLPMSQNREAINNFMDDYCMVEWIEVDQETLDELEQARIRMEYLPLNYQHTLGILTNDHRKILSNSKKEMRK